MVVLHLVKITHSPYRFKVLKFNSKVQSARELELSTKPQTTVSGNEALKSSRKKTHPKAKHKSRSNHPAAPSWNKTILKLISKWLLAIVIFCFFKETF